MSAGRRLSVVGLGYVGLPVAVAFARSQNVVGFDIDEGRIEELRQGVDRTWEVEREALVNANVTFTAAPEDLRQADFHIVAVPTPVDDMKQPDLRPLLSATRTVGQHLKRGDVVVFESTVFPGATEECCVPVLEQESGLKLDVDFGVGYSPERINPGDRVHRFENICKIVSGSSESVLDTVAKVYESVVEAGVFRAASVRVAEAAKVIENTQRDINIALMNELAVIFAKMGIDTRDVLAAAGTKWNFLGFEPGLVGGHCIGVDPYYLTHKAMAVGHAPEVITAGRRINDSVGAFIARAMIRELLRGPSRNGPLEVCILGLSFKENVPDLRNSRVVDVVEELRDFGVQVAVCDPLVDARQAANEYELALVAFEDLGRFDGLVLAVAHDEFADAGWPAIEGRLRETGGVVFDVKGILPRADTPQNVKLLRL